MNRRNFLYSSLLATTACSTLKPISSFQKAPTVLILGGTKLLGPIIVREFIDAGYEVVLFNRGKTNPHLFPNLEKIKGDRETQDGSGLVNLVNDQRSWDLVVDTWQASPKAVYDAVKILKDKTKLYQYVSTISVYDKWDHVNIKENTPLNPTPKFRNLAISPDRYAIRKTIAENIIRELIPNKHTILRSHGLRGYPTSKPIHEPYWAVKILQGGDFAVPAAAKYYQVTDMVSMARFMVTAAKQKVIGAYNIAYKPFLFKDYLNTIIRMTDSKVKLHWLPQEAFEKHNVKIWRPEPIGRYRFDVSKAEQNGLVNRPIEELIADQLKGYFDRNPKGDFKFSEKGTMYLSKETEQKIIREWNKVK